MSDPIRNIGHPVGMAPQTRRFDGHDDTFINADGVIELMKRIDTPQAKKLYRDFRRRYSKLVVDAPQMDDEKRRAEAVMAAVKDSGFSVKVVAREGEV